MKKFILYVIGAIFLFVSCQSDELESDEALVLENNVAHMKAVSNATRVTKNLVFQYSKGEIANLENEFCDYKQFVLQGGGIASLIGKYSVRNEACIDESTGFLIGLVGWITAANGDVIETASAGPPYPAPEFNGTDNFDFILPYIIVGGTGRFDGAEGMIYVQGELVLEGPYEAVGWGEITY